MVESKFEVEAYLLILATWNFARFRYVTRTFDLRRFEQTIADLRPVFQQLAPLALETVDLKQTAGDIRVIYERLKELVEQTGAAKIMHFKLPKLFVMWDMAIRRSYRVPARCSADDYLEFLASMKSKFAHLKWTRRDRTFAKAIDEYNFVLAHDGKKKRGSSGGRG